MPRHRVCISFVLALCTAAKTKKETPSVLWHAPFYAGGGYCSEATAFVLALEDLGVEVRIDHHGDGQSHEYVEGLEPETLERLIALSGRPRRSRVEVAVCHSEPGAWHVLGGPAWASSPCPRRERGHAIDYVVGRTMFETDRLPDGWPARLNAVDEVWVPTAHHKAIFDDAGVANVHVVAEPVDTSFYTPDGPRYAPEGVSESDFVVVSVFKWERRKGWDVLLEAWHRARLRKGVLVLVTNAYHSSSDFDAQIDAFAKNKLGEPAGKRALGRIVVASRLSDGDLAGLYRRADLVALPTRGEGWGRPHVEAMASGTAVAATAWSGPAAYLDETNGYPLRHHGLERVGEGPFADHMWAAPDAGHLAEILRRAAADPAECGRLGAKARADMVAKYAPEVLARDVKGHLDRIHAAVQERKARDEF